jgi:hypothetical protein
MYGISCSTPMTVANQHWVLCPTGEGRTMRAEAVYALSPEAAVEDMRKLFAMGDYMEPVDTSAIRLAEGVELPWNMPECVVSVVTKSGRELRVYDMDHETILFVYGADVSIRRATPAEAEESIRENTCARDEEDEEQFNYGFNVLYKEQLENGDFDAP